MSISWEDSDAACGQPPTLWQGPPWQRDVAYLHKALNPWQKCKSSLMYLLFLQSSPVQHASQGWRISPLAWAFWKWLTYYNLERERKKDTEWQPRLGLRAISGSGGKESTKNWDLPSLAFLQDFNVSNWNGPLLAPGFSYSLNALTFKGSTHDPWYFNVKVNLECSFAKEKEFTGLIPPRLAFHFGMGHVRCWLCV